MNRDIWMRISKLFLFEVSSSSLVVEGKLPEVSLSAHLSRCRDLSHKLLSENT